MNRSRARRVLQSVAVGLIAVALTGGALAQASKTPAGAGQKSPAPAATPPVGQQQAIYLVRSTLMTLNDANRSGNYTVLRDLAAPEFAARNSPADLAGAFLDLRRRRIDLFPVALLEPRFDSAPALDPNGRLHLTGVFLTQPLQIRFDLTYGNTQGQWKLFGISVATPQAPGASQPVTPSTPPPNPPRR